MSAEFKEFNMPPKNIPSVLDSQYKIYHYRLQINKIDFQKKCLRYSANTLLLSGFALTAFSALLQFSVAFTTLIGISLSPLCLAAIALMGLLLLVVSAQQFSQLKQLEVHSSPPSNTPSCLQRLSASLCCFKLFRKYVPEEHSDLNSARVNTLR